MDKILLINPLMADKLFPTMPPLGLASIAAVLEKEGYPVEILDLDCIEQDIEQKIRDSKSNMICISGTTPTRFESFRIAKLAKKIRPDTLVIYGGPHAMFTAQDTLINIPEIDIIVHGEGEYTVRDLARHKIDNSISLEEIKGISFRKGDEIISTPIRDRIKNLDELPFPAYHLLPMSRYTCLLEFLNVPAAMVITSRGCPVGCVFCAATKIWGNTYARRSPQNVFTEIEYLRRTYDIKGVKFFDSTLTLNKSHIESLCDYFIDKDFDLPWECEIRADTVSFELLAQMKRAGCYYVDLGMETASQRVLKIINKKITVRQVENVLDWCNDLGIKVKLFIMCGLPEETLNEALETREFMRKHRDRISKLAGPSMTIIFPGTKVFEFARVRGYLPKNFSWSKPIDLAEYDELRLPYENVPVLMQPQFGKKEYSKAIYEDMKALGHFSFWEIAKKIFTIRSISDIKRYWYSLRKYTLWKRK